jgi:hypothetical protein
MASKAMGIGSEAVVNWFTNNADHEAPFFSVWSGRNILFSNINTDFEKAVDLIVENIEAAAQNGYDDLMTLKLNCLPQKNHEGNNKSPRYINDKTPVYASFQFRPVGVHPSSFVVPYDRSGMANNENVILQKLNGIEERLNSIENGEDDDQDENVEDEKTTIAGIANNLLSSPEMQRVIIGFIGNLAQKFLAPKPQNLAINGIPNIEKMSEEEKVLNAVIILQRIRPQIVEDLVTLANIAETDPNKANWILSMLPK